MSSLPFYVALHSTHLVEFIERREKKQQFHHQMHFQRLMQFGEVKEKDMLHERRDYTTVHQSVFTNAISDSTTII